MKEIWKPVVGFEGRYDVSNLGNFKALAREITYTDGRKGHLKEKFIQGSKMNTGYISVTFDSKTRKSAHQVVAEAFFGVPKFKTTVNHKNGNKTDNRLCNIEWASYKENNNHARTTGLNNQHGEKCNLTKYSDQFIDAIRNVHAKYSPTYVELGKLFGLTGHHVRQIVLYETIKKPTK